jgi:hypothetical protein
MKATREYVWTRLMIDLEPARTLCNRLLRTAAIYSIPIAGFTIVTMMRIAQWQVPLEGTVSALSAIVLVGSWFSVESWSKRLPISALLLCFGLFVFVSRTIHIDPTVENRRFIIAVYLLCAAWSLLLELKPAKLVRPAAKSGVKLLDAPAPIDGRVQSNSIRRRD